MIIENVGYIHDDLLGGTRPMTNFEFIQTCTMEELAESLLDVWYGIDDVINIMSEDGEISKKDAMIQWLKQPHKE